MPHEAETKNLLCKLGRLLSEGRLVEPEARREDQGRVVLLGECGDDVKESLQCAVVGLLSNRDERRRNVRRHADGVLDIEALRGTDQTSHLAPAVPSGGTRWDREEDVQLP